MGGSILVTGARGFTGCHFISLAEGCGYQAVPLNSDLSDRESIMAELCNQSFDYVVHLGAISFVGHGDSSDFYRVNVIGTQNLLDALLVSSSLPKKVLIASSANIYGNAEVGIISEEIAPAPVNHYAISKLAMEHLAKTYFNKLPIVIARPFNYTGPGQNVRFVIPKIVDHFKRRANMIELGNTDVTREYNDVRFVCNSYLRLMESDVNASLLNVCTSKGYRLSEVIEELKNITGHSLSVSVNPQFVRENEIKILLGDSSNLCDSIGPISEYSLSDTLRMMLQES
ncbi:GDP-mannose 4,6-dehydratase [Microbulbifer variabilis]|uniref:GDP-mannose 4,6-dehydratase n=1 Tax=Microbulbifer variabilis TaxID=266805 RepID=UPI001CFEB07E|nr:GDP-mannose 4,6-dehydratase [Microbulbifer variabilis]